MVSRKALLIKSLTEFLTVIACHSHSKKRKATDIQEEEIRMNINLPYFQGANEKIQRTLKSHKIRSTFYTKTTLHNLLCKAKYLVATEDKNNIVCEIDGSILLR